MNATNPPVTISAHPKLKPSVISAPFGNYILPEGATATLGTFTALARGGRVWRILKTVRYYPRLRAWVNKIGLRNPGIQWVLDKHAAGKLDLSDKLISIHGFNAADWTLLLKACQTLQPLGIELNMSCPNVGEINWPEGLFAEAVATGVPVVVKLPPVCYEEMAEQAVQAGVRSFHCCNTLPVQAGGMSGQPLKPVALQCLRDLKSRDWAGDVLFLGGGGIYKPSNIDEYVAAGADAVAIGTKAMNPWLLVSHGPLKPLIEHAAKVLPEPTEAS